MKNETKNKEILNIIKKHKEISIYDIVKELGKKKGNTYGNVYYYIRSLEKEGLIELIHEYGISKTKVKLKAIN